VWNNIEGLARKSYDFSLGQTRQDFVYKRNPATVVLPSATTVISANYKYTKASFKFLNDALRKLLESNTFLNLDIEITGIDGFTNARTFYGADLEDDDAHVYFYTPGLYESNILPDVYFLNRDFTGLDVDYQIKLSNIEVPPYVHSFLNHSDFIAAFIDDKQLANDEYDSIDTYATLTFSSELDLTNLDTSFFCYKVKLKNYDVVRLENINGDILDSEVDYIKYRGISYYTVFEPSLVAHKTCLITNSSIYLFTNGSDS
jgi:hypothetical protein